MSSTLWCTLNWTLPFAVQVIIPFPEDGSVAVEQNVDLPEEESPSQEPDKAVTCVGTGQDGAGWLGTAANFLSRSFYWWHSQTTHTCSDTESAKELDCQRPCVTTNYSNVYSTHMHPQSHTHLALYRITKPLRERTGFWNGLLFLIFRVLIQS